LAFPRAAGGRVRAVNTALDFGVHLVNIARSSRRPECGIAETVHASGGIDLTRTAVALGAADDQPFGASGF
jgi:hypothetical protein